MRGRHAGDDITSPTDRQRPSLLLRARLSARQRRLPAVRSLSDGAEQGRRGHLQVDAGLRHCLGRMFGWDHVQMRPEDSLLSRLSERDRRDSEITPGTPVGSFLLLYQFPGEALSETRNATVHGYICTALAPTASGYRLYWGIYVIPVSWLTRPYLIAIEPFRRILYPAMLRRIRRAWLVAYGATA